MAKEFIISRTTFKDLTQGQSPLALQGLVNSYVEEVILTTLEQEDVFASLKVFALGSLGMKKLCLYSDIDLLVLGDRQTTESLSKALESKLNYLKIRHIPYDPAQDMDFTLWLKDITIFDHYSLLYARAFKEEDQKFLLQFWNKIQTPHIQKHKDLFLNQILDEKNHRSQRYGQVAGMLQPNIKFGRGGLRDITQALGWLSWWSSENDSSNQTGPSLHSVIKERLLLHYDLLSRLRFAVHLIHDQDYISNDMWPEVLKSFPQFYDVLELQKKVHKTFNAVKVASEYVLHAPEFYKAPLSSSQWGSNLDIPKLLEKLEHTNLNLRDALELRLYFQNPKEKGLSEHERSQIFSGLHQLFLKQLSEHQCTLLFDSLLVPQVLPYWDTIEGRPQSGHYHQYTVDQHLLKTLVAVCQIQNQETNVFRLSPMLDTLKPEDWQMLKWVSLFHDLAKGLPGDHSEVGAEIVMREVHCDLWSERFKQEISEMVRHHLLLSKAAFRYDHNDAENLQQLYSHIKSFKFFKLLTLFTAADIMASNPEAWNEWKADQFYLLSESFQAFVNNGQVSTWLDLEGFQILATLVKRLSEPLLKADVSQLDKDPEGLAIKVLAHEHNIWIRAHDKDDGPGVLVRMLNLFFQAGLSIEQAFICGHEKKKQAYNWFRLPLKTSKSALDIERTLKVLQQQNLKTAELKVLFENIKCLSDADRKWVFLFKGRDQKGLLLRVAQVFAQLDLNILKAQVSTWGESVEDVFVVEQRSDLSLEDVLEGLRRELMNNYWH